MGKVKINGVNCFFFIFSEHYSISNILPKDSSKVSYTLKITVSKQFDIFAKRALRVTETGTSRINTPAKPCMGIQPNLGIKYLNIHKKYLNIYKEPCSHNACSANPHPAV